MCFSATASFGLGSALIVSRVIQHQVQPINYTNRKFILSLFPLLFGAQQVIEGFVWLSFDYSFWGNWKEPSMHAFVFIAQVIWPFAVPFAFMKFESHPTRKSVLKGLSIVGATTAVYLFFNFLFFPIDVTVQANHLIYELNFQQQSLVFHNGIFYFIPTVIPPFMISNKKSYLFGMLVLLSFILSRLLFPNAFISIWCYFAAGISLSIYWLLKPGTIKD